jgi:DNA modification methylase
MSSAVAPGLELRPAAELIPYARNSNTHPQSQLEKLKASLREFGWTNPVLIDERGGVVAGHGRLLAYGQMLEAGETVRFPSGAAIPAGRVPVLSCSGWSEAQKRAYVIADNRIASDSSLDEEVLALELADLKALGFDLSLTGLDAVELGDLLGGGDDENGGGGHGDPDLVPDVPEVPVSRRGDVWIVGGHRVMCGSSLEPNDWDVLMAGESADCVFTDPPYNVAIGEKNDAMAKAQGRGKSKTGGILNDSMGDGEFYKFLLSMYRCVLEVMKPGASIYVYHADSEGINFRTAFRDAGFKLQSCLTWKKNTFVLSRWDHHPISEPCLYGWKPGAGHKWYGGRKQSTFVDLGDGSPFHKQDDGTWAVTWGDQVFVVSGDARVEVLASSMISEPKPARSDLHPTMKPVMLVRRHLRNSAQPGDLVVDAFGGSGTTMLAAHEERMLSRLMELDPKYVDVICRRMWAFSGLRPVHAVTGEPFPGEGEFRSADLVVGPSDAADDGGPF